jgi:hypothetical protein
MGEVGEGQGALLSQLQSQGAEGLAFQLAMNREKMKQDMKRKAVELAFASLFASIAAAGKQG